MPAVPKVPISTYRLQFNRDFTFRDAERLVPYLRRLGISHIYASPFLKARPGSAHGYDIIDHNALNPELGSASDFDAFCATMRAYGMGLLLDFVPNHMGIGKSDNEWWIDVLEWGQSSIYADFFDIDWTPRQRQLQSKVLVPLLGDHYGAVLESGALELRFDETDGTFSVWYHEHKFPIRPRHYAIILRRQLAAAGSFPEMSSETRSRIERLAADFDQLRRPGRRQRVTIREHAQRLKGALAALCRNEPSAMAFVAMATSRFVGTKGDAGSFRQLHALLERQYYRLAFWRVASDEINYRRFFNINELAGIRIENATLFELAHRLTGEMIASGRVHGLRIDHIDGLFDPETYCRRLQAFAGRQRNRAPSEPDPVPFFVVVEKILAQHESLRESWPVAGTTGYDFVNLVNGLFVDPAGRHGLERVYRHAIGRVPSFDETLAASKNYVIDTLLASELNVLANELDRISEQHWRTRDYTAERLRLALKEIVINFPVYRTYATAKGITSEDQRDIDWAVGQAKRHWRGPDFEILDFVRSALTTELARQGRPYRRVDIVRFAMKFQQYTGPVMAKAMEDTCFYRYNLLLSLNEVGGDPRQFAVSPTAFHHANRLRARQWPHSMLATATHDTKRGEDVRTRIDVLSELPAIWEQHARRWVYLNRFRRRNVDGAPAPSRNDEYMIYQTLLGAWPFETGATDFESTDLRGRFSERMKEYVVKAVREAKLSTSWTNPNAAYEDACTAFVDGLLDGTRGKAFLSDFVPFQARVAELGMLNSLGQVVLKLTVPGVPDFYQGTELWDANLVDPDNRRPVDFMERERLLAGIRQVAALPSPARATALRQLRTDWRDGQIKLYAIHQLLRLRQLAPELFLEGAYEPVQTVGTHSDGLVAFLRRQEERQMLVVTGRLFARLLGTASAYDGAAWADTAIAYPSGYSDTWQDVLTGRTVSASEAEHGQVIEVSGLLDTLPVAVLTHAVG